ncbi:hypothetical protein ACIOBL_12930 [Paenibacillus taichungensis]|uniref:hypothetical protein n=1 Tax=Paenibacillus taichungensis TaxID=484184 RepID=UPI003827247D
MAPESEKGSIQQGVPKDFVRYFRGIKKGVQINLKRLCFVMLKTVLKELDGKVLVRSEFDLTDDKKGHAHEFWSSKEAFEKSQVTEVDGLDQEGEPQCRVVPGMSDEEAINLFESLIHNSK